MEQYRIAATTGTGRRQRTPVASVPIRKKSVPSRTDHGQNKNWRLERRASSKQSPSPRKKPIVDFGHREIGGRMSALERAGIKPTVPCARKSNTTTRKTNSVSSSPPPCSSTGILKMFETLLQSRLARQPHVARANSGDHLIGHSSTCLLPVAKKARVYAPLTSAQAHGEGSAGGFLRAIAPRSPPRP